MDFKTYTEQASRTISVLETNRENDLHMILGMVTEVGELADAYKKNMAYGKKLDLINVQEEVGDLMWYIANFCRTNGFDMEKILETNINKLRARYPEKFDAEKAVNRDLETERKILNDLGFKQATFVSSVEVE